MSFEFQESIGVGQSPCSSPSFLNAWDIDIVVEEILSNLGNNPIELIKYRRVCHKFNDIIVDKINKLKPSFKITLRYGPQVPKLLIQSDAQRWTMEIIENTTNVLTGSAAGLHFDSLKIYPNVFINDDLPEWKHFLEMIGKSILHLRYKVPIGKSKKAVNRVIETEEMSLVSLRTILFSTPNLKTLNFCIPFSNDAGRETGFPLFQLPKMSNLLKMTFWEPSSGYSYFGQYHKVLFSMAPHLTRMETIPSYVRRKYYELELL